MVKKSIRPLAIKGLVAVLASTSSLSAVENKSKQTDKESPPPSPSVQDKEPNPFEEMHKVDAAKGNMNYHLLTEQELLLELDDEGTKTYNGLDSKGKELARFVASAMCQNSNACKGLGACATGDHECAGKNSCKGKSKCGQSDKNVAVRLAADRIAAMKGEKTKK